MTVALQKVIEAALTLAANDKLELLQVLATDLQQNATFSAANAAFWEVRSLDEIAATQQAGVINDVKTLAVDFWPDDESADDFNDFVADQRRIARMNS